MNSHWNLLSMSTVRAAIALVLLTAGLGASFAQDTPPASSPATEAASEPATSQAATSQAASEPATRPTSRPAANGGPIALNFKDASVRSVLEYLSESAGLIILGADKVEGRITLISRTPVSTEEAVSLLDTVLREKGYAAVHPEGTRTLKVMTINDAKKDLIPVRLGNVPEAIKPSDKLITQIVLVRHADAVKLKADLAAMIPSSADVASNAASNTLIITATESVVRRLVEVISKIDAGLADVLEVKVFQLKYANATAAAKLILDIFKQDQAGQGSGGGGGGGRGQMFVYGMQGPGGGGGEEGQRATKVTASADDRTNTLVVSAAPDILKSIEKVVKDLDANPAETQAVYTYRLKNGVAKNLESVLNATFGATGTSSGTTGQRTNTQQNQRTTGGSGIGVGTGSTFGGRTSGGSSGSTRGGLGTGSTGNTGNTGRTTGGTAGTTAGRTTGGAFGAGRTGTGAGSGAAGDLIGQVYVVADADTNSLLVTTSSNNWPKVKLIIADLDKAVPQVLIKVLMAEVTHNKSLDLGVEFSGLNLRGSQVVSGLAVGKEVANVSGAAPMSTLGRGESGGPNFGVAAQTNGLLFRLDEKYVTAAIRAIANNTKLDVLSRPYILTSDNQEASILVGQQVPFITNSQISDTGQVNNTIQYQDIGIKLDVTPHINPQGLVTLDTYTEISALTGETVQVSETVKSPVVASRWAQNRVAIRDGQTIVIGGLMQDQLTKSVDKVPLLGDIPLLGLLFQNSTETKTKTELLIFLTPHVAQQPDELKTMAEDEKEGLKLVPNAVEPGTFQEHMKGLERGASTRPSNIEPETQPGDEDPATQPATRRADEGR